MAHWESHLLDAGLGGWRQDWDRLNAQLYESHPLFDSRFIEGLLRHFGSGDEHVLVLQDGGAIVGMTLLTPSRAGVWQSFLPSQLQVAPVLVADRHALSGIFDALPGFCWQIELLSQDPLFSPLFGDDQTGQSDLNLVQTRNALTMQVLLDGSFDEYWQSRSRKLRQNIKRYRSRMEREGLEPKTSVFTDPSDMAAALARYGDLESSGWKGANGTAIHIDNPQGAFYREMLEAFAATGQACVYEYYAGADLSASRLFLGGAGMLIAMKTTYMESLSQFSPGRLLLQEVLSREFDRGDYAAIEFYTNATKDQLSWSSEQREICHFGLLRNRSIARLYTFASEIRARLRDRQHADSEAAS